MRQTGPLRSDGSHASAARAEGFPLGSRRIARARSVSNRVATVRLHEAVRSVDAVETQAGMGTPNDGQTEFFRRSFSGLLPPRPVGAGVGCRVRIVRLSSLATPLEEEATS